MATWRLTTYDRVMSVVRGDARAVLDVIATANRFVVQQVFKPIANEYRISAPAAGTDEGEPLLFVKQKRMKIKEDIRFRLDPDADDYLFMIKSRTVFEFRGRHDVLDASGQELGLLEKAFGKSLLRSHWIVRGPGGDTLFESHESSWIIAIVRRFADLGPDWLSILTWLPFNFVLKRGDDEIGTYRRVLGKLRDRYVLELGDGFAADRRLV